MDRTTVLTVGEALIDIVLRADGAPATEHVGGSPANVAIGLAALGHDSKLAAYLGDDDRGRRIRDHLAEHDVSLADGAMDAPRTSTATARVDPDGVAVYDFDLSWRVPTEDLTGVAHLHTGSIAATVEPGGSAVVDLMLAARVTATVSYDPNCRPTIMGPPQEVRARIEECIGRSDVVKASLEDVEWLYGEAEPAEVAGLWGQLGPELVVITRGGDGALVHLSRPTLTFELAGRTVEVVDTVGAGDSFMAGLVSGLLDAGLLGSTQARERLRSAGAEDVATALDRAMACAAWTVTQAGAAAPTKTDLEG